MLNNLEKCFLSWKQVGKLGNIVSASKMFLNLLGNIFAPRKANFVSAKMSSGVGKLGNMDSKQNFSATVFPSLPRASKLRPLKCMTSCETLGKNNFISYHQELGVQLYLRQRLHLCLQFLRSHLSVPIP